MTDTLKAFNFDFMKRLFDALSTNVELYSSEESWVRQWAGQSSWEFNTPFVLKTDLELSTAEDGSFCDLENSIRLHSALSDLTLVQAQDPRLWTHLTHVELWDYMRSRRPKRYPNPYENVRYITRHYFVHGGRARSLIRNGASRLWWAAKLTHDNKRDDPYELTAVLFSSLDLLKNLLERNFGRSPAVTRAFLEFVRRNEDICLRRGTRSRNLIRDLSRAINMHGGMCLLDSKAIPAIIDFLSREAERLMSKEAELSELYDEEESDD
jgi:hypothetical protein